MRSPCSNEFFYKMMRGCGKPRVLRAIFFGSVLIMLCSSVFRATDIEYWDASSNTQLESLIDMPRALTLLSNRSLMNNNSTGQEALIVRDHTNARNDRDNDVSFSPSPQCSEKKDTNEFQAFCQTHSHSQNQCQRKRLRLSIPNERPTGTTEITNANTTATEPLQSLESRCKTIWITGMSIGFDGKHHVADGGDGYMLQYAAAIRSYTANAKEILQPVLVLITPPPPSNNTKGDDNNDIVSQFTRWVEAQGVIVIRIHKLSFQDLVFQVYPEYATNGAIAYYLRFDIPKLLLKSTQHKHLLDKPDICGSLQSKDNVIFYTDSDVLFVQPISYDQFQGLKNQLTAEKFLMYGQDFLIRRSKPSNTGVLFMHLEGFVKEWPRMLKWGKKRAQKGDFPVHDQLWLNYYFAAPQKWKVRNLLLPPIWNWKVYWEVTAIDDGGTRIEIDSNSNSGEIPPIQIVHFHGPKPKDGVEEIAFCDTGAVLDVLASTRASVNKSNSSDNNRDNTGATSSGLFHPDYEMFVSHGMCCDSGKTAAWILKLYEQWKPATSLW